MVKKTCLDCGKPISRSAKRCKGCTNLMRWASGLYDKPECKERHRKAIKAACQRPKVKRRKSESAKKSWQDPRVWKKHSQSMKAAHASGRHDNSAAMKAAWARGDFDDVFTEEIKQKQADAIRKGIAESPDWVTKHTFLGENNPNWRGGIAREPYPHNWSAISTAIRKRDSHACAICGNPGDDVHHKDYNKKNNAPDNLVTLCKTCHGKTNFNRPYWQAYFTGEGYHLMLGAC